MSIILPAAFFTLGAIIASFVGVISGRLSTGQGFLTGRSCCDACTMPLSSLALIPIVSYLVSGGKARCCGARINALSPITEILLGMLFVLSYLSIGLTSALPFFLFALATLLTLVLYDLSHQILPYPLLAVFVVTSAMTSFLISPSLVVFRSSLTTALLIGMSLAFIHLFSRGRAMGLADAPFAFGLALLVGQNAFSGFVYSFWIGALIGIALLYRRPRGSRMGGEVPFAPFLAAGFLLAYFTQWNLTALITGSP